MIDAAKATHTDGFLTAGALVVAACIFLLDLRLPLGASIPSLYVLVVLLGLWSATPRFAAAAAVATSLLTALGALLSPAGLGLWVAGVNRPAALLLIGLSALGVVRYKRAERHRHEERRRAQAYLDIAAVPIVALDLDERVLLINPKGCELVGRSADDIVGRDWIDLSVPAGEREHAHALFSGLRDGSLPPGHEYEMRMLSASGDERRVEWRGAPIRNASGQVTGTLSSGEDTTERRKAEAERRRAEATLHQQQTLARLGELAAVVAHEVRNPLAGIRATIQVLSKRLPPSDQATVKALFTRIDALNEMTEDLLLFARPRPLQLAALPLKPLLRDAIGLLTRDKRWSSTQVQVEGDDACARADALALRGVFLNLLLNAAEAMGGAGTVRVSIETSDAVCRISIRDGGPGVPAELRQRIFEPFFTTKHRGTGLGLAIVRRQVELHSGEISIACPPDRGTIVTVVLPLASPAAQESPSAARSSPHAGDP